MICKSLETNTTLTSLCLQGTAMLLILPPYKYNQFTARVLACGGCDEGAVPDALSSSPKSIPFRCAVTACFPHPVTPASFCRQ